MARPRFEELVQEAIKAAERAFRAIGPHEENRVYQLQGEIRGFEKALDMHRRSVRADVMEDESA